jgi:GR25 family glycosyltransferase involved in LPS biosynthesis
MITYLIYNPEDELSTKLAVSSIDSCRPYGIDPILFLGSFGTSTTQKISDYKLTPANFSPNMTVGEYGCFVSHYELWNRCFNDNVPLLILEHDVYMKQALPNNVLDLFEDVLNLDGCSNFRKDAEKYNTCAAKIEVSLVKQLYRQLNQTITWKSAKTNNVSGAHAYIIKPTGAKKLIDAAHLNGIMPADVHINGHYVNISITDPSTFRFCDFMMNKKNRVKYSSTKGYKSNGN